MVNNNTYGQKLKGLQYETICNLFANQHTFPPVNITKRPYAHTAKAPWSLVIRPVDHIVMHNLTCFFSGPNKRQQVDRTRANQHLVHLALCLDCPRKLLLLFFFPHLADDKTESVSLLSELSHFLSNHSSADILKIKEDMGIHTHTYIVMCKMCYDMCVLYICVFSTTV